MTEFCASQTKWARLLRRENYTVLTPLSLKNMLPELAHLLFILLILEHIAKTMIEGNLGGEINIELHICNPEK